MYEILIMDSKIYLKNRANHHPAENSSLSNDENKYYLFSIIYYFAIYIL